MNKEKNADLTEKQQENKREDKKAFRKFIVLLGLAFVIGIGVGIGSSLLQEIMANAALTEKLLKAVKIMAIYGGYVFTTIIAIVSLVLYNRSRAEYTAWDEEEEEVLCKIESRLAYVLWFSNLVVYMAYFFFSVGVWATGLLGTKCAEGSSDKAFWISLAAVLLHIVYAMAIACIIQQKAVNLSKEINPEKSGSIYDMKFHDKWLRSCDEAERYAIYKCSFKTFKTMQITGMILWLVCLIGQIMFGTGVFATIIVTVFMIIQTSVYSVQGIYFAKHPSEVMK